jgi:hypothetical protein
MRLAWLAPLFLLACGGPDEVIPEPEVEIDAAITPFDAPPDGGGGTGDVCGGLGNPECAATHFCDWGDNSCGADDGTGTCQPRPEGPCADTAPTCGCDGTVHGSECEAQLSGSDVSDAGGCTAPADTFACGHGFCVTADEYCERTTSDVEGSPDSFSCEMLPGACGAVPDCACLLGEPCGAMCEATGGGFTLTCPGG